MYVRVIDHYFNPKAVGSSWQGECMAGLTTFLAMAYIVIINPTIMKTTGMDFNAVFVATCLVSFIGTMFMAIYANQPIALAPAMSMNTYFAYSIVGTHQMTWQTALGAVFIAGLIIFILSNTPAKKWLFNAVPKALHHGISFGVGLFVAAIGLRLGGIIVVSQAQWLQLAPLASINSLLFFIGFIVILLFAQRQWPGGILAAILLVAMFNYWLGLHHFHGLFSLPPSIKPTLLAMTFPHHISFQYILIIFSFVLVILFDSMGSMVALTGAMPAISGTQHAPEKGLLVNSLATAVGGLLGTSSTCPYIENATGIAQGARTGLSALVVAILMALTLLFLPLVKSIPTVASAPALLYVGLMMIHSVWKDVSPELEDWLPMLLTGIMIVFSGSIANGFGLGVLSYVLLMIMARRFTSIHPFMLVLSIVFIAFFMSSLLF